MKNQYIEYLPLLETHNPGDIVFLKSLLDAEGITYFVQGEHVAPFLFNALPMRLLIKKDEIDQAKQILSDVKIAFTYGIDKSIEKR